jgi:hypothetical protein
MFKLETNNIIVSHLLALRRAIAFESLAKRGSIAPVVVEVPSEKPLRSWLAQMRA